jgi:hypothetical protein
MPPGEPHSWADWIEEAHGLVSEWESTRPTGAILTVQEAVGLAERIARSLQQAYERGRHVNV